MADGLAKQVEKISGRGLSSLHFLQTYAAPGRPVILEDVVPSWPCWTTWRDEQGEPNFSQLVADFQGCDGPVTDCQKRGEAPDVWDVSSYLLWAQGEDKGSDHKQLLYLKDWHLVQACRAAGKEVPYEAPAFLDSPLHDWLNLHKDTVAPGKEDYRFCYVGVKGTRTPLHHDVLFSHSWSANICGMKHWIFYPPEVSEFLLDEHSEAAETGIPRRCDPQRFPRVAEAWEKRLEAIQYPGQLIFVPSGWYHEVENLSLAVSINHNWLNASNAEMVWGFLLKELEAVKRKIGDERKNFSSEAEFLEHCQVVLQANSELDLEGWLSLLTTAAEEVDRRFKAQPQGEELHEVEWVATKLRALIERCLECPALHELPKASASAELLRALAPEVSHLEAISEKAAQVLSGFQQKYQSMLMEHHEKFHGQQLRELELWSKNKKIQERRRQLWEQCGARKAQLSEELEDFNWSAW